MPPLRFAKKRYASPENRTRGHCLEGSDFTTKPVTHFVCDVREEQYCLALRKSRHCARKDSQRAIIRWKGRSSGDTRALVAKWIMRCPPEAEIPGSSPGGGYVLRDLSLGRGNNIVSEPLDMLMFLVTLCEGKAWHCRRLLSCRRHVSECMYEKSDSNGASIFFETKIVTQPTSEHEKQRQLLLSCTSKTKEARCGARTRD